MDSFAHPRKTFRKASPMWLAFFVLLSSFGGQQVQASSGILGLGVGYHLPSEQLDVLGSQPAPTPLHGGPHIGLYGGYHIIEPIALELHLGLLPAYAGPQNAVVFLIPFHLDVIAYFTEGSFRPYISGGAGAYALVGGELEKDVDFMFTGSLGCQIEMSDMLALRADVRVLVSDGRDQTMGHSLLFSLALDVMLGDGSTGDEAPTPLTNDSLGMQKSSSRCVPDASGKVPEGCNDRDDDGISNADDSCPDTAGIAKFKGCPDTDGDGLPDTRDRCPVTAGVEKLGGCPDRDGDGIEDSRDGCPEVAGSPERHGCPDRLPAELERLNGVLSGVAFSEASTLSPGSGTTLSRLASALSRHPEVSVEILVYTQLGRNSGQQSELAQERAQVIFNTLVQMGVAPTRLKPVGLGSVLAQGETQPSDRIELRIQR